MFFYWLHFCYACWGITVLSLHLSSFHSSVLRQQADLLGVFPDTGGTVMVSAKQSSWRRCNRATRPASVATFRRRLSCTQKPRRQIHKAASCTATAALLKLGLHQKALDDAGQACELNPKWPKVSLLPLNCCKPTTCSQMFSSFMNKLRLD